MATYHGLNEDETCRTFVLPALAGAGWSKDQVRRQYRINEGRLVATSRYHARSEPLIADYDVATATRTITAEGTTVAARVSSVQGGGGRRAAARPSTLSTHERGHRSICRRGQS
jgi:hypothetical protein